jgi:hypothetical protein
VSRKATDEVNVTAEAVQLGDGYRTPLAACFSECSGKLRATVELRTTANFKVKWWPCVH